MLEPDTRELLVDALRPPDGWELVHAVGTTYSLDLQALLFAPLSFALFDWALDDDGRPNPIAMLEALRRYADRTTVFCQAGQIGLPADYPPLLVYLEPSVVPVTAPTPDAIFHPKLWLLRFRDPDTQEPDRYRLLCLSRNLTFDTSWDTALVLDGERRRGGETVSQNRPLVAFVRALVDAVPRLDPARRQAITDLAGDVADVRFDAPEGFDSVRFHPLGLADGGWPVRAGADRVLVMAPFLTAGTLGRLTRDGSGHVLVSRPEMIDAVGPAGVVGFDGVYVLSEAAVQPDVLAADDRDPERDPYTAPVLDEARGDAVDADPSGLHAKLVVGEYGGQVRLYTGSANATDAAYGGNVEFVVELRTRQPDIGIDRLLAQEDGVTTLRTLLEPYEPNPDGQAEPSAGERLGRVLDVARRRLGACRFTAVLTPTAGEAGYGLELSTGDAVDLPGEVTGVHCWPISKGQGHQVTPRIGPDGLAASFGRVAEEGITAFYAFEVHAADEDAQDLVRFVVGAELVGAPEDRAEQVIVQILRDRQDVLRYLLFLLADTTGGYAALMEQLAAIGNARRDRSGGALLEPPLFETLLRALARAPSRLDHIAGLLDDLRASERAGELIPPGLDAVWEPIWQVRQELGS